MTEEAIRSHPNYSVDDHAYLRARGWSDREILARWEAERRAGREPIDWDNEQNQLELWRALARADLE